MNDKQKHTNNRLLTARYLPSLPSRSSPSLSLAFLQQQRSPSCRILEVVSADRTRSFPQRRLHQTEGESSGFPPPWGPKNAPSSGRGRGKRGWMDEESEGGRREEEEGGGGGAPACGCSSFAISLLKGTDRAENSSQCVSNNFPV